MQTLDNIQFNQHLFSQFDHWIVTLYQINEGISLVIPIFNVDLLTFVQHFKEITSCQDFIRTNNKKTFTLFTYSENIQTWLWNKDPIPDNLHQIIIFCPPFDERKYIRDWTKRFTRTVKDVITCDDLGRELLLFGMRYIDDLCSNFKGNANTLQLLLTHQEQIRLALVNAFAEATNRL
jgi:hypothetical protein